MDKLTVKEELDKSSLESFLKDYFNKKQPATYLGNELHTNSNKRRSFSDIVVLCKSYFECTEEEIAEILINLWEEYTIGCLFCPGISKVVFYNRDTDEEDGWYITPKMFENNPVGNNIIGSYNKPTAIGEDGYTFTDIYNLAKQ